MEDGEVERLVVEDGEVAILESEVDKFENILRVSGIFGGVAGVACIDSWWSWSL